MLNIFGFFKKRKEFKESQKYHQSRKEQLEIKNEKAGVPTPDNWINEVYHRNVYKTQKSLKRVLTKEEKKAIHKDATCEIYDFVDKHLFPLN